MILDLTGMGSTFSVSHPPQGSGKQIPSGRTGATAEAKDRPPQACDGSWAGLPLSCPEEFAEIVESLQTRLQHLNAIIQTSREAVICKDLNGTITSWNQGAERLYGYLEGEVIGQNISLIVPDERAEEVQQILERIRNGELIEPIETVRRRSDGSLVEVRLRMFALRDRQGRIIGGAAIARDLTEVRFLQRRLRQALKDRNDHFSAIAKELRGPIWTLLEASRILSDDSLSKEEWEAARRAVQDQSESLAHLLDGLDLLG